MLKTDSKPSGLTGRKTDICPGGVVAGFLQSVAKYPGHTALVVDERLVTYRELASVADRICGAIKEHEQCPQPMAALLVSRSLTAYASVLGILLAGKGYVPLNPRFPVKRTRDMMLQSEVNTIVVDNGSLPIMVELLSGLDRYLTLVMPEIDDIAGLASRFPKHRFVSADMMPVLTNHLTPPDVDTNDIAYLLFTSGSTGKPKGVPVSHGNVISYIDYTCDRYAVTEHDRFSQAFDMTFDLSVHDMFVSWERGACLCCVPQGAAMAPAKFINDMGLTMWFSVPSVGNFMSRLRMLKPGVFPTLRCSLFAGEPLTADLADKWQKAAPNSIIENLWGVTEGTVASTNYRWHEDSAKTCVNGIVPIGNIFEGQRLCVIDEDRMQVQRGEPGEVCVSGSQVTTGYLNNTEKTRQQFVKLPEFVDVDWYLTGDLAREGEDGCLYYLGRIDDQVQVLGHRVELQEIDHILRRASGDEGAVSLAWPLKDGVAEGIEAFVGLVDCDRDNILSECRRYLPEYMVPRRLHSVEHIPLNANGKVDRSRLMTMLEEMD